MVIRTPIIISTQHKHRLENIPSFPSFFSSLFIFSSFPPLVSFVPHISVSQFSSALVKKGRGVGSYIACVVSGPLPLNSRIPVSSSLFAPTAYRQFRETAGRYIYIYTDKQMWEGPHRIMSSSDIWKTRRTSKCEAYTRIHHQS